MSDPITALAAASPQQKVTIFGRRMSKTMPIPSDGCLGFVARLVKHRSNVMEVFRIRIAISGVLKCLCYPIKVVDKMLRLGSIIRKVVFLHFHPPTDSDDGDVDTHMLSISDGIFEKPCWVVRHSTSGIAGQTN